MKYKEYTRNLVLCAVFTALIVAGAFMRIPIPVVPFTMQFMFTNLAGIMLGKKWGAISVLIYIALGLIGVPVFTQGGGISYVFQPSFGYIIGFVFGTFFAGLITEKTELSIKNLLLASVANMAAVYTCGLIYFYFMSNYYLNSPIAVGALFIHCFLVTLPGDIASSIVCAILGKKMIPRLHLPVLCEKERAEKKREAKII